MPVRGISYANVYLLLKGLSEEQRSHLDAKVNCPMVYDRVQPDHTKENHTLQEK